MSHTAEAPSALDRLQAREEIMQICYWYQGEGFGERFSPAAVMPFLNLDRALVADIFEALAADGTMEKSFGTYAFTAGGKRGAGRLFVETFTEFQTGTHGECTAGCCEGDEVCDHD
ncbi:hypothetical protein [Falsiroseomonas oryzae]|uniref:hypothetical protein n=1 Tax=Falsiroseomonas oryzae TaxID=2766473 RepID=UPI0022EA53F6|nr:hypothetical protein [Roseomonas sp. MO-31]